MFRITTALKKLRSLKKRVKGVAGGTSASKTISILQILIDEAQRDVTPTVTSVVSESLPHLKRGAIRDFLRIMKEHGYFKEARWNKTDYIYTFESGSILEFFSASDGDKNRGPRRQRLFINEGNRITLEAFNQLEVRTEKEIWIDWNPVAEFWWYTDVTPNRDVDFITLTYKDNEGLSPELVQSIESRKYNKNWWKVYGEGQLGEAEGKIYRNWQLIDEIPKEARLERFGLDFGYSNDPTALVAVYYYNGTYILDELTYQKGLSNKQIADIISNQSERPITIADSAEPKSIDEIISYGITVIPSSKGQGSVQQGIQYVQSQKIFVTKRSIRIWKEYWNYFWLADRDGNLTHDADHNYSHAMDAIRYAITSLISRDEIDDDDFPDESALWNSL